MPGPGKARQRKLRKVLAAFALALPLLFATYHYRFHAGVDELSTHASQRLALASASLNAELQRFASLPAVLAEHPALRKLLADPGKPTRIAEVNDLLERMRQRSDAAMLYLMDPTGKTLAASNWRGADSFVGQNYGFRPYFRVALAGGSGMFFGVGVTTRVPGFFIAHPVLDDGRVVGVLAVKVELDVLESTWAESGESLMVVDQHGVVALSSNAAWNFATLTLLTAESRRQLQETRQYFTERLAPLPLQWLDEQRVALDGRQFVVQQRQLQWIDWRMLILADTAPAAAAARSLTLAVGLGLCVVVVGSLYWRQRARRLRERLSAQSVLERTVSERTADLAATNDRLQREIDERVSAEQKLRVAQRALIEANRLAALGQMAAGVAHELNQPLSALRGFAGNSLTFIERRRFEPLQDNLHQIIELIERMARLTAQLKVFASRQSTSLRRSPAGRAPVRPTIATVAGWFARRLEDAGISLRVSAEPIEFPLEAQALEQVLSNLLGNAVDALAGRADAVIELRASLSNGERRLEVADNGPGIPAELRERISQPFFSTKPLGQGLGLGLPIVSDLVEGSGGRFEIAAGDGGEGSGTVVRARWPASTLQPAAESAVANETIE
ncbi:ATP-binding protein [Candidatus Accumulibacter sp. ACC003]|uniref:sensor histidine kinase n=1 Tax=Candidatus Accumulibacter sp. ACC003 TaxID=2823334 RepID=UPI0025BC7E9B|nr:ATP-binding protein [Candidatus Accumulibacter sp. ACC003]